MRYQLVGTLRSYTSQPPEMRVWDFDQDRDLAWQVYQQWSDWMAEGLWQFRDWGWTGEITCIKPGAFIELDLRLVRDLDLRVERDPL